MLDEQRHAHRRPSGLVGQVHPRAALQKEAHDVHVSPQRRLSSAVDPSGACAFTSAPVFNSAATSSREPLNDGASNGNHPSSSRAFGSAPWSSSSQTPATSPAAAASLSPLSLSMAVPFRADHTRADLIRRAAVEQRACLTRPMDVKVLVSGELRRERQSRD